MASPSDDVLDFVLNTDHAQGRDLDIAIVYAACMVEALRTSIAEWQAVEARLREMKAGREAGSN
jgi:hypothetical protein